LVPALDGVRTEDRAAGVVMASVGIAAPGGGTSNVDMGPVGWGWPGECTGAWAGAWTAAWHLVMSGVRGPAEDPGMKESSGRVLGWEALRR
jgi:hypothetical protein